jgi:phosphonate transport system substrate-binding protein
MNKLIAGALGALFLAVTAQSSHAYTPHVLRVGFTPWENPQDMAKSAGPIVEILSKATGMQVQPFLSSDYAGVINAMQVGKVDLAFFPPGAYVMAEKKAGAEVILKSQFNGRALYYAAIFTTKDSGIRSLKDLKGKTMAFVDPTSTSGGIYPKVMLMNEGINPERDLKRIIYAGGHDAAVLAVARGKVQAGAAYANDPKGNQSAWNLLLKDPKDREKIRVLAISKPIPADNISVRKGLSPQIVGAVKKAFLDLSATPQGRARIKEIYHVDGFVPAAPSDYVSVREAFDKVGLSFK